MVSTEDIAELFAELENKEISQTKLKKFLDKTMDSSQFCNKIKNANGQTMIHVLAVKV